jgi:hypothetical protein
LVYVAKGVGEVVMDACGGEQQELLDELSKVFVLVENDATVFKAALETPNDPLCFSLIAVR